MLLLLIFQTTYRNPTISAEREPLSDVTTTEKEVKVVLEMLGIKKEDFKIIHINLK
jgi:HSP20 family protein